jgi:hypothetical protein
VGADCNPAALGFEYLLWLHYESKQMNILEDLRSNVCEVTFTKANGSERTMICTLIPDFLPFEDTDRQDFIKSTQPDDLVTVWDIETDAWRSFKPSKVVDIKFSKE